MFSVCEIMAMFCSLLYDLNIIAFALQVAYHIKQGLTWENERGPMKIFASEMIKRSEQFIVRSPQR